MFSLFRRRTVSTKDSKLPAKDSKRSPPPEFLAPPGPRLKYDRASVSLRVKQTVNRTYMCVFVGLPVFAALCLALSLFYNYLSQPGARVGATGVPSLNVNVEDLTWPSKIEHQTEPMVVVNSFVTQWQALEKWQPEALTSSRSFLLSHVDKMPHPFWREFSASAPLTKRLELQRDGQVVLATSGELLNLLKESNIVWHGSIFDLAGTDALNDIQPVQPLLQEPNVNASIDNSVRAQLLSRGMAIDIRHESKAVFVVQVVGTARYTIYSPVSWAHLYLNPTGHSAPHHTQVSMFNWDHKRYPLFQQVPSQNVVLQAGEVLFIPPFWFYATEAFDESVSLIALRSNLAIAAAENATIISLSLRRSLASSKPSLKGGLFSLISMVLESCSASSGAPNDFVQRLLLSRFWALSRHYSRGFLKVTDNEFIDSYECKRLPGSEIRRSKHQEGEADEEEDDENEANIEMETPPIVIALVKELIVTSNRVCEALEPLSRPVATILLQDYIQNVITLTIGVEHIPAFLYKCFIQIV